MKTDIEIAQEAKMLHIREAVSYTHLIPADKTFP